MGHFTHANLHKFKIQFSLLNTLRQRDMMLSTQGTLVHPQSSLSPINCSSIPKLNMVCMVTKQAEEMPPF